MERFSIFFGFNLTIPSAAICWASPAEPPLPQVNTVALFSKVEDIFFIILTILEKLISIFLLIKSFSLIIFLIFSSLIGKIIYNLWTNYEYEILLKNFFIF